MISSSQSPAIVTSTSVSYVEFASSLSKERLQTYRVAGETDDIVLAKYCWNQALVDAFGLPMHLVEVALRNAVVRVGDNLFGAPTKHGGVPSWLDANPPILHPGHAATTAEAREALLARRVPRTPGRLIAELNFGFWVNLFNRYYDAQHVAAGNAGVRLWNGHAIRAAYPNIPRSQSTVANIRGRLDTLRQFRNRLAHHEPIFNRNLADHHRDIVSTLRWLSAPAAEFNVAFDQTLNVLAQGPAPYLPLCRQLLGLPPTV